jgi:hypothetical protein
MGGLARRTALLLLAALLLLLILVALFAPEWAGFISFLINDPKWVLGIFIGGFRKTFLSLTIYTINTII